MAIQREMDKIDQRLDELYKNWQAEYRYAVMLEDCEEIRKFYKPYLEKYESKYSILYHLLQQTSLFSTQEPTSGITPSLAALDNAQTMRWREWIRDEHGEEMPQQYSSISGYLTLTSPRQGDMRLDPTLNVMLEGSPNDLPAVIGDMEEVREGGHQVPEGGLQRGPSTNVEVSIEVTPETLLKVKPKGHVRETPRRIQRTREASREEAIAWTRQFFATVNERNRGITEGPIETSSDVCGRNENGVLVISISDAPITPVVPEVETTEKETRSPRTFLPNGSPSRPTATATCRPRTWVQCISKGQMNEPTQDDIHSTESVQTEHMY